MPPLASASSQPGWGIVLLRVYLGGSMLYGAWHWILAGAGASLIAAMRPRLTDAPAWYAWFAEGVLLRAPGFSGQCIQWSQFLFGTLLLLGVLVRPVGVLSAVLMLVLYLGAPPHLQRYFALAAVCALALALSNAGRRIGLDRELDQRWPAWLTWAG